MTAEHCATAQGIMDQNSKLEQELQSVKNQLGVCQNELVISRKNLEKVTTVSLQGTVMFHEWHIAVNKHAKSLFVKIIAKLTNDVETRLYDTEALSDAIGNSNIALERLETLIEESNTTNTSRYEEFYESRPWAAMEWNAGPEGEEAMMIRVQKCAESLLNALQTSIEVKLSKQMQEIHEITGNAMKGLERKLETIVSNQRVSRRIFGKALVSSDHCFLSFRRFSKRNPVLVARALLSRQSQNFKTATLL